MSLHPYYLDMLRLAPVSDFAVRHPFPKPDTVMARLRFLGASFAAWLFRE